MRSVIALVCLSVLGLAQSGFGTQRAITTTADGAWSVYATDLDGDGDADVLSASWTTRSRGTRTWGWGASGPAGHHHRGPMPPDSVFAADLDGDGDADVLSASWSYDDKIAWYENLDSLGRLRAPAGHHHQWPTAPIRVVFAADLDGDGDADVLSASDIRTTRSRGTRTSAAGPLRRPARSITTPADGASSVHAIGPGQRRRLRIDCRVDASASVRHGHDRVVLRTCDNGAAASAPKQVITTRKRDLAMLSTPRTWMATDDADVPRLLCVRQPRSRGTRTWAGATSATSR